MAWRKHPIPSSLGAIANKIGRSRLTWPASLLLSLGPTGGRFASALPGKVDEGFLSWAKETPQRPRRARPTFFICGLMQASDAAALCEAFIIYFGNTWEMIYIFICPYPAPLCCAAACAFRSAWRSGTSKPRGSRRDGGFRDAVPPLNWILGCFKRLKPSLARGFVCEKILQLVA